MIPIYMLCDGSLGTCDCKARRAAAISAAWWKARPKHGTLYTYKKCKEDNGRPCAECRKANAAQVKAYRDKKRLSTEEKEH